MLLDIDQYIERHQLPADFLVFAESYVIPIAEKVYLQSLKSSTPFFVGINGCQGIGKTTITAFIKEYLERKYHIGVSALSLDDFYLDQQQRLLLAKNVHPLLQTRGVPGTHNIEQIAITLNCLKMRKSKVIVPQFSKEMDNPDGAAMIKLPVDIVLFEGWCWGVKAQSKEQLQHACNTLEREQDQDRCWRKFVNNELAQKYAPLYSFMDFWLFLKAPSFNCVYRWRWQQEQMLKLNRYKKGRSAIMSDGQIKQFILLFQRLTEQALKSMAEQADVTLCFDEHRKVQQCLGLSEK